MTLRLHRPRRLVEEASSSISKSPFSKPGGGFRRAATAWKELAIGTKELEESLVSEIQVGKELLGGVCTIARAVRLAGCVMKLCERS